MLFLSTSEQRCSEGPAWHYGTSRGLELPGNAQRCKADWSDPMHRPQRSPARLPSQPAARLAPLACSIVNTAERFEEDPERWDGLS